VLIVDQYRGVRRLDSIVLGIWTRLASQIAASVHVRVKEKYFIKGSINPSRGIMNADSSGPEVF